MAWGASKNKRIIPKKFWVLFFSLSSFFYICLNK